MRVIFFLFIVFINSKSSGGGFSRSSLLILGGIVVIFVSFLSFELSETLRGYLSTGRLYISVIPDIESVNYGRYVGYDVIYHEPPTEIGKISGTSIRNGTL